MLTRRQERLVLRYIDKLGIASVYLGAGAKPRPVKIATDSAIADRVGNRITVLHRAWCRSGVAAHAVIEAFGATQWRAGSGGGWFDLTIDDARTALAAAARQSGVALTGHDAVIGRATEFVSSVEAMIRDMNRRGELKHANRAYQAYRIARTANHQAAEPYRDWLDQHLTDAIDATATRFLQI